MDFITSGGIIGNLIRGVGQRLGIGKTYNQPTYDLSEFNAYGLGGSQNPVYYDDLDNEEILKLTESNIDSGSNSIEQKYANYLLDAPLNPFITNT